MPKCTINGKEVEVRDGQTIMEAFNKDQAEIAYYCWHPGLSVAGVCRMCMVEVEGNPKLQIACNTPVVEGMKVNNTSEKVKESVKWTLDFHLINHPLDCPICDQAGECGLQEFYMAYGKYDPEMGQAKVKKKKVVSLGPTVVLDSERCILCSRCTRFTTEVTKTNELGIFNRGDHSEIGLAHGKTLDNKYSVNVVDICPVGALTAKDFRFKQRVWYLKEFDSVCNGCSTGCNVKMYHNQNGMFRVKPVYNENVNGHWMCDEGRDVYKFVNLEYRQKKARHNGSDVSSKDAASQIGAKVKAGASSTALVLTGQYTVEEYQAIIKSFKDLGVTQIYHWNQSEKSANDFDGILLRGDRNPNTKGLQAALDKAGVKSQWSDLVSGLSSKKIKTVVVAGPENQTFFPDLAEKTKLFSQAEVIWLTACKNKDFENFAWVVPLKTFAEKNGTFVNFKGVEQKIKAGVNFVSEALCLKEFSEAMTKSPSKETQQHATV